MSQNNFWQPAVIYYEERLTWGVWCGVVVIWTSQQLIDHHFQVPPTGPLMGLWLIWTLLPTTSLTFTILAEGSSHIVVGALNIQNAQEIFFREDNFVSELIYYLHEGKLKFHLFSGSVPESSSSLSPPPLPRSVRYPRQFTTIPQYFI